MLANNITECVQIFNFLKKRKIRKKKKKLEKK